MFVLSLDIHKDTTGALDKLTNPMIKIMRELPKDVPNATHVAFTHNGICWEIGKSNFWFKISPLNVFHKIGQLRGHPHMISDFWLGR